MAQAPKCCSCKNYHFPKCKCDIYNEDIPQKFFLQQEECTHYASKNTNESMIDDLPVAKGR